MTWPEIMGLIVLEGLLITVLVLTGFRRAVFEAIPPQLKTAIAVGIGFFLTIIGLADAGIVRPGIPLISFGVNGQLAGWPTAGLRRSACCSPACSSSARSRARC